MAKQAQVYLALMLGSSDYFGVTVSVCPKINGKCDRECEVKVSVICMLHAACCICILACLKLLSAFALALSLSPCKLWLLDLAELFSYNHNHNRSYPHYLTISHHSGCYLIFKKKKEKEERRKKTLEFEFDHRAWTRSPVAVACCLLLL